MNTKRINKLTVDFLLPIWCNNIFHNEKYINEKTNFSSLLCNTFPKCYRLEKLKTIHYSDNEYTMEETVTQTELPNNIIKDAFKYCNENFQSYIGTNVCENCKNRTKANKPALIIAGGPSLETHKHLNLLNEIKFRGDIFCTSIVLKRLLEINIIPKYFSVLDAEIDEPVYLNHDIIHKYNNELTALFSVSILPKTNEIFKGKRFFYNPYLDNEPNSPTFNVFRLMTKCSSIHTGGNIGTTTIMLAAALGYNPIIVIGYDLSFQTPEEIKRYYKNDLHLWKQNPKDSPWDKSMYHVGLNPHFNKKYYTTDLFYAFKESSLFLLNLLVESGITIINCTEQGAVYHKNIISMPLIEYLKSQAIGITKKHLL